MRPETDIGVIRAASEVLTHPVGVCRDYAILFTALARAAGVPARVCGGIVYFRDGFYYHAWSEVGVQAFRRSGVQESSPERPNARTPERLTWVAFDATLPTDFVDATHLKFAQGDPTAMFQAVRVVGQLKAEVLDYQTTR
jgi:transglutaminase-like putative cysteine protease